VRVIDSALLIDSTLREIAKSYTPGTLRWIKKTRPKDWARLLVEEQRINKAATEGDLIALRESLSAYQKLIVGLSKKFEEKKE